MGEGAMQVGALQGEAMQGGEEDPCSCLPQLFWLFSLLPPQHWPLLFSVLWPGLGQEQAWNLSQPCLHSRFFPLQRALLGWLRPSGQPGLLCPHQPWPDA